MAYRQQLYISPTTLTDLTVTIEFDNPELPSKTLTLNDFSIVDDELNAGFTLISDCTVTIQSQGYETKILNITTENHKDKHIILTPLLDYFSKVSDGTDTYFVKAEVIKNQQNNSSLKYWTGTKAQYDAIATKDNDTIYNITNDIELAEYANLSLTNVNDTAKITMAKASMPSDTYKNITIGASGTVYTAPADGWFYVHADSNADTNYHQITIFYNIVNDWATPVVRMANNAPNAGMADIIPVRKGQQIRIEYGGVTMKHLMFMYAVGSESEVNQ